MSAPIAVERSNYGTPLKDGKKRNEDRKRERKRKKQSLNHGCGSMNPESGRHVGGYWVRKAIIFFQSKELIKNLLVIVK